LLVSIQQFLGFGYAKEEKFYIYKRIDCLRFISLMKPGSIVKYQQLCAFEILLSCSDPLLQKQMYEKMSMEKHKVECFHALNQNDKGKEGYEKITQWKKVKLEICKEIKNKKKKTKEPGTTQQERNIQKRKITADEIYFAMEEYSKNIKATEIYDKLFNERNKCNVVNTLTMDIIKNIKRNLKMGKPNLYPGELDDTRWKKYLGFVEISKQLYHDT
jgi:hypothetical protein